MGLRVFFRKHFGFISGNYLVLLVTKSYPRAAYFLYYPFRQKYFLLLGGSTMTLGWMSGTRNFLNSLAQVPGGYFADKVGRRRVLVLGHFLTGLGWIFRGLAPDWKWFFAVQMFMAVVYFYRIADDAAIIESLPPESRGVGLTMMNMVIGIAGLFSPVIGGIFFDMYGSWALRIFLIFSGVLDITQGLVFGRFLKETLVRDGSAEEEGIDLAKHFIESLRSVSATLSWIDSPLIGLVALSAIYSFSVSASLPFLTIYALDFIGLQGVQWGWINMAQSIAVLALRIPIGKFIDRYSNKKLIILGLIAEVLSLTALTRIRGFLPILAVILVNSVFSTLTNPTVRKLRADYTPNERRGRVGSVFSLLNSFSMFFGSIIGGYIYEISPVYPFMASAFFEVIGVLIVLLMVSDAEKREK